MKIFAHDEDSLGNLLFSEINRHNKLQALLKKIIESRLL